MTSFNDIQQDPNHPFWAFVAQLDGARNNNNDSAGPSSSRRDDQHFPRAAGEDAGLSSVPLPHRDHEHGPDHGSNVGQDVPMTPPPPPHPAQPPHPPPPPHSHRSASPHRHHHHDHHHGPHHGHRGGPHGGSRGGRGAPRGAWPWRGARGGPPCGPFSSSSTPFTAGPGGVPVDLPGLANWVHETFLAPRFGGGNNKQYQGDGQDFTPAVDVFSTDAAFLVHVSLPGALKQDIAVNWSAETSSLIVSGVITRSGVENLVRITGEREIGAFERKVVLWAGDENIKVDEDHITAKLEDGVLKIDVPKVAKDEGFVDVKRVDID